MPRIKRWFPVSHDINGDPEVWELTDRFGERALRVWLEILSVSDRNEGEVKGQRESIATALSSKCRTTKTRVLQILEFAETRMWMVSDPVLRVRNREKYLPRRVQKEHPTGSMISSPPSLPSPSLPFPCLQDTQIRGGGRKPDTPPPDAAWAGFEDVRRVLAELQVDNGLADPAYWKAIDSWIESSGFEIYYLDELKAYIAHQRAQPAREKHKDLRRGFRNWLATAKRWKERDAQREAVKRTR